jgi:hypothetical protein
MKKLILIALALICQNILGFSQEYNTTHEDSSKHFFVTAGVVLLHFIPTDDATDLNWKTQVISPGGEVLFGYEFNNKLKLKTGLYYQYGNIALKDVYYGDRTMFHEISIPVICDFYSFNLFKTTFNLSTGIYMGKYVKIRRETKGGKLSYNNNEWVDYPIKNESQDFISDIYLSFVCNPFRNSLPLHLELFSKYRLTDQWLNDYVSRFYYGIKINYLFPL